MMHSAMSTFGAGMDGNMDSVGSEGRVEFDVKLKGLKFNIGG
jgi:hypothetical protein